MNDSLLLPGLITSNSYYKKNSWKETQLKKRKQLPPSEKGDDSLSKSFLQTK